MKIDFFKNNVVKFESILGDTVDACVDYISSNKLFHVLELLPAKEQPAYQARLNELADPEFQRERKETYKKIFEGVFSENGIPIRPQSKFFRRRLVFSSPSNSLSRALLKRLAEKDPTVPVEIQKEFNKTYNGRCVIIDLQEVIKKFPEYNKLLESGNKHPELFLQGEAIGICKSMLNAAKLCGYNIVDLSSTYANEIHDLDIDVLSGVSRNKGEVKAAYKLVTFGITGEKDEILKYSENSRVLDKSARRNILENIKSMALPNAFSKLAQRSYRSLLIWTENATFSVISRSLKGDVTKLDDERCRKFESHININNSSHDLGQDYVVKRAQEHDKLHLEAAEEGNLAPAGDDNSENWIKRIKQRSQTGQLVSSL